MKTFRLCSLGFAAAIVVALSDPVSAQFGDFYASQGYINTINTALSNSVMGYYTSKGNSSVSKSNSTDRSSIEVIPAYRQYPAVQFKSTGTSLKVREAAELVDPVPADRPETERLLSDILTKYEAAARAKGYPNDWALALVSYIGLNMRAYHGKTEKPIIPFEQNIGLRDLVAEQATENGIFKNATDRKKQELYEIFVMFGGLTDHLYEKALKAKNAEDLKACKNFAAQNLKAIGIKP